MAPLVVVTGHHPRCVAGLHPHRALFQLVTYRPPIFVKLGFNRNRGPTQKAANERIFISKDRVLLFIIVASSPVNATAFKTSSLSIPGFSSCSSLRAMT